MNLRKRLTREATGAVLALVWGFGALAWSGTAWHLYVINRGDAYHLAQQLMTPAVEGTHPFEQREQMAEMTRPTDPKVWIRQDGGWEQSPNAGQTSPPSSGLKQWNGPNPAVVVRVKRPITVVVEWPLGAIWDVLRELATVLAGAGIVAGAVSFWLADWAARRMLFPVDQMVAEVTEMVRRRQPQSLSERSDADDEFHRLSRVLNQLLQLLADQAQRERQMLAQAAHELRTPLQVLQGNLEILAEANESETALRRESLDQSRQVTRRMIRMVTDLLTLERAVHPHPHLPGVLDLDPLLTTIVQDTRALASLNRLTVEAELFSALVRATAWSVERAVWTVVDNALKYTPPEGTIRLEMWRERDFAGIRIKDSGPGIDPHDLPRIFDRFYRGAKAARESGSGLGLSIAKALVEQDGGLIRVMSSPGAGTTVELGWPRTEPEGDRV